MQPSFIVEAQQIQKTTRVVVIAAHHDDIEFGSSGTIARWIGEGADVTYVIVTDGGSGSNEVGIVRNELSELRRQEQLEAATYVGVSDVRFLGYCDGTLQATIELRRDLTRIIRELKPERVVCSDPRTVFYGNGYINHPDHRAAGEAALYAIFPSSVTRPIFPELLDEGFEPHKVSQVWLTLTNEPTHFVNISDFIEQKVASLRAHRSQLGKDKDFDNAVLPYVLQRNADAGQRVGVKYAELYKVMFL